MHVLPSCHRAVLDPERLAFGRVKAEDIALNQTLGRGLGLRPKFVRIGGVGSGLPEGGVALHRKKPKVPNLLFAGITSRALRGPLPLGLDASNLSLSRRR